MNERPTPRTDAVYPPEIIDREFAEQGRNYGWGTLYDMRECARDLERELDESKAYANKCRDGCISLSHSISRIDYACGEPNEMGVSDYCVHQDEAAVVERVKARLAELEAMREAIGVVSGILTRIDDSVDCAIHYDQACDCGKSVAIKTLKPFLKP